MTPAELAALLYLWERQEQGGWRPVQYFHSRSMMPLREGELEVDSEDEGDDNGEADASIDDGMDDGLSVGIGGTDGYLLKRSDTLLRSFGDLGDRDRLFMRIWNVFMHRDTPEFHYEMPAAVLSFAR